MVHSQVTRRIDNQSVIINRNGFVFEFLTPSKRIERLDENNSSLLSDHIHIHPCAPINPIVYSSVIIRFRWRRKKERKKKSRLLLSFEKLGNKKVKKRFVILRLERNSDSHMRLLTEKLQHYYFQTYIFHRYRFQFFLLLFPSNRICTSVSPRHFIFNANLFKDIRFQNNILDYSISTNK